MQIAALYYIHGNLPALNAELLEIDTTEADLIIICGYIVLVLMPRICIYIIF